MNRRIFLLFSVALSWVFMTNQLHGLTSVARGTIRPRTSGQLYAQRVATLQAGQLYSRVTPNTFVDQWQTASHHPTHQQWQELLAQEARMMAFNQRENPLTVFVGDSLFQWLPMEYLPDDRLWLNQSVSGETTAHIVERLTYFEYVRPDAIYIMAGVNDLKNGIAPDILVSYMELIVQRLKVQHPQSRIVVLSILPTRLSTISNDLIQQVNQQIAFAIRQRGAEFVDLQPSFLDDQGQLRLDLTTDGIHLSPQGYSFLTQHLNSP
jgi:lysophospholipase L1-like esterase